ncbi:hypothetical protein JHK87_012101 [Glycine soja]|nr:hypothetical protein JHK87_012101 [Glycine soja]
MHNLTHDFKSLCDNLKARKHILDELNSTGQKHQDDIEKLVSKLEDKVRALEEGSCMDAIILPLHGSLPPELQASSYSL